MAKAYFQQRGIEYKDIDVSKDVQARKEMIEKSQQMGVPVIDMDGEVIIGFDKPHIEELLAMRQKPTT